MKKGQWKAIHIYVCPSCGREESHRDLKGRRKSPAHFWEDTKCPFCGKLNRDLVKNYLEFGKLAVWDGREVV